MIFNKKNGEIKKEMNKKDIIEKLSERIYGDTSECNIKQITQFCDTFADICTDALIEGNKIAWKGFLNIEVIERKQRCGRNPQTNEIVVFPPTKSVKCKISKTIKDMVNEE